jgi:hypothetical protein
LIGGASAAGLPTSIGYRGVFALAGVFLLLGALFVLKVQESERIFPPPLAGEGRVGAST